MDSSIKFQRLDVRTERFKEVSSQNGFVMFVKGESLSEVFVRRGQNHQVHSNRSRNFCFAVSQSIGVSCPDFSLASRSWRIFSCQAGDGTLASSRLGPAHKFSI